MDKGMDRTPLGREFFDRPVLEVAPDLLGRVLVRSTDEGAIELRLTEVEAYAGEIDPGSHAYRGRTARNAVMFGEPGRLYVYRHLGLHHCVNVVTGPAGAASAMLLRAGEVVDGVELARDRRLRSGVVDSARYPWRFWLAGEPTVSAFRPAYRRPASGSSPQRGTTPA